MLEFDGTFIIAALSFIVFVYLMNIILYKPMVKILGEREEFFAKNENVTKATAAKTQAIIEDNNAKIATAQKEAAECIKCAAKDAKAQKAKRLKEAEVECEKRLCDIDKNLEIECESAKAEVVKDIKVFVKEITSKVLGKNIETVSPDAEKTRKILKGA